MAQNSNSEYFTVINRRHCLKAFLKLHFNVCNILFYFKKKNLKSFIKIVYVLVLKNEKAAFSILIFRNNGQVRDGEKNGVA